MRSRTGIGGVCAVVALGIAGCAPAADQTSPATVPEAVAEAIEAERSDALPLTAFYDPLPTFRLHSPGRC